MFTAEETAALLICPVSPYFSRSGQQEVFW